MAASTLRSPLLGKPALGCRSGELRRRGAVVPSYSAAVRRSAVVATVLREKAAPLKVLETERRSPAVPPAATAAAPVKVRAVVTVRRKRKQDFKERAAGEVEAYLDKIGAGGVLLELIGDDIDPKTGEAKRTAPAKLKGWFEKKDSNTELVVYHAEFTVDPAVGRPGAVAVRNLHRRELHIDSIAVEGLAGGAVHFPCHSWIQPSRSRSDARVFFSNEPYLPNQTPAGLRQLRAKELRQLRGEEAHDGGEVPGERRLTDRVYDYDVYNDLGNPDKGREFARPVLGGAPAMPYPRRLRTGRPPAGSDPAAESRVEDPAPVYVPRDDEFEERKLDMIAAGAKKAVLHNLVPLLVASVDPDMTDNFDGFHAIDNLFKEGLKLKQALHDHLLHKVPFVGKIKELEASGEGMLRYDTPEIIKRDKFAWLRDDEFARQALAGINPVNIERVTVFPPVSNLDPAVYGPPESAITEEHLAGSLDGLSVKEALEGNRLFMLDYHDAYLPYLDKINALDGRKAYATRTVFFLTSAGTLKTAAIELCLPPATENCKRARRVFTPPADATASWLWQLAKAHVCSNDAGVHQLVNHWLRTHACVEPFIIAAHRQMSAMHPVHKLLKPHMRYTLRINALARQMLINGDGVIEAGFTAGRYGMELSSAFYRDHWRFDLEGLPADLLRRGMAVQDAGQPHGLRLLIEDYPYAADGLLLWSAIAEWVAEYVSRYYPSSDAVCADAELQAWYAEAVEVGHADKRSAPGWPELASPEELAGVLTTLIWLCSAQHAALNFGQYPLGGYIPNRPPMMRRLVPAPGDAEYAHFVADPHRFFLSALPSLTQTTTFMTVIDTLSTHSADEEYLGERPDADTWTADAGARAAAREFADEVRRAEEEIARRNGDPARRNRCGAGVLPYELMAPSSPPGITCRGVPNSVTI